MRLFFLTLIATAICSRASAQHLAKTSDTIIDPHALVLGSSPWGTCINGQSFQQDALTSFRGWQYATWYDANRRVCVGRKSEQATEWQVIRFEDFLFDGNDPHNVTVLGLCPADGTIHLAFDHHNEPLHYRVSVAGVALRPDAVTWSAELFGPITSDLERNQPLKRVTYPRFLRTPKGGLQFSCRIGGSGDGDKCLADYNVEKAEWTGFGTYASSKGNYLGDNSRNAYLNGLTYDRQGRLHVTWCWREIGDPMTNHDLCYAMSADGGFKWTDGAGREVGTRGTNPFSVESPGIRAVEIPMNRGLVNTMTQAVDSKDRIHVVSFHMPDDVPQQSTWLASAAKATFFHYWRDDDGSWKRTLIPTAGDRPQLWFDSDDNAYLVFCGDQFHKSPFLSVWAASTDDDWKQWKLIHQEQGPFFGQPLVDRYTKPDTLSVYVQQEPVSGARESPLRVLTYIAE